MVNFKVLLKMYENFIENDVLGTQDLLKLGLNKNDLTRLVATGKLVRPKKGKYAVGDVEGLLVYSKVHFGKRNHNPIMARKALAKAVELSPDNGKVQTRMFLNAIIDQNFDQALKSFEVMDKTDNIYYKQDQNMWLYLLSFVGELPEKYQERVRKMTYADIKVLDEDKRYEDKALQEKIRTNMMNYSFKVASSLTNAIPMGDKKIASAITEVLLKEAIKGSIKTHNNLYALIDEHKYAEAVELLKKEKSIHGLNRSDEQALLVMSDLLLMNEEKKAPVVKAGYKGNNTYFAIQAKDYVAAERINSEWFARQETKSRSAKVLHKLLEEAKAEVLKLGGSSVEVAEMKTPSKKKVDKVGGQLFTEITLSFMQQDVDQATELIGQYLEHLDKKDLKDYVNDLVKLSVLNDDKSFVEPLETLAELSKNDFEFTPAGYIQDFYFNLARKKFQHAAVCLDILSMSEKLGSVHINVGEMKNSLLEDAMKAGYTEESLGLKERIVLTNEDKTAMLPEEKVTTVAEVMSTVGEKVTGDEEEKEVVGNNNGETVVPQDNDSSLVEEPSQVTYTVLDAVDRLLEDTNLIMLEPMSEEDIERVVETTTSFQKIQTYVLEEETGEKRVVLRYYDEKGPYVDFKLALQTADSKFKSEEYEDAIDLYQSVLPKLESPRAFIYARLGEAYEKCEDYCRAIDYYTMAEAQSNADKGEEFTFSEHINKLKEKSGYNGVSVTEDTTTAEKKENAQYKKV